MPQFSTLATISRMEIGTNNLISENIVQYLNNGPNYRLVGELNYFRHIKHLLFKHWIWIFSLKVLNAQPQHYFFSTLIVKLVENFEPWEMNQEQLFKIQDYQQTLLPQRTSDGQFEILHHEEDGEGLSFFPPWWQHSDLDNTSLKISYC